MENFVENYWQLRLKTLQERLEKNNFEAVVVQSAKEAAHIFMDTVLPKVKPTLGIFRRFHDAWLNRSARAPR